MNEGLRASRCSGHRVQTKRLIAQVFAHDVVGESADVLAHATATHCFHADVSALDFADVRADVAACDCACDHESRLESPPFEVFDQRLLAEQRPTSGGAGVLASEYVEREHGALRSSCCSRHGVRRKSADRDRRGRSRRLECLQKTAD
jgi:hypothetical protein